VADDPESGHLAVWMVRTIVIRVDTRAAGGQQPGHPSMDVLDDRLGKKAPREARLIAHHHDGEAGAIERLDRGNGPREQRHAIGAVEIADFFDDGAIAVEEDRALESLRHEAALTSSRVATSTSCARTPRMHA